MLQFVGHCFYRYIVDNEVLVNAKKAYIRIGSFLNVMIEKADHFDLYGVVVE